MRKFINHVDHAVYLSGWDALDANIAQLEALTDASLQRCERPDMGCIICVDWSAGLEVVAPFPERSAANEHLHARLETQGEGLLGIVYGVDDLDAHMAKLTARGFEIGPLMTGLPEEPWFDRIVLRERFAPAVMGSWLVLSQIDYRDDVIRFVEARQPDAG